MHHKALLAVATASVSMAFASSAGAQMTSERSELSPLDAAPKKSLELTVGAGYTQPFGQLQSGSANNIGDIANAGFAANLGVGYRIDPRWSIGAFGEYQEFSTSSTGGTSARGVSVGPDLALHLQPFAKVDPYLKLGTGGRLLWANGDRTVTYRGIDWARIAFGLDIKSNADLALGPFIGADLTTFYRERVGGNADTNIDHPRLSTFVFAGIQGRLDVGGHEMKNPQPMTASLF